MIEWYFHWPVLRSAMRLCALAIRSLAQSNFIPDLILNNENASVG